MAMVNDQSRELNRNTLGMGLRRGSRCGEQDHKVLAAKVTFHLCSSVHGHCSVMINSFPQKDIPLLLGYWKTASCPEEHFILIVC